MSSNTDTDRWHAESLRPERKARSAGVVAARHQIRVTIGSACRAEDRHQRASIDNDDRWQSYIPPLFPPAAGRSALSAGGIGCGAGGAAAALGPAFDA